MPVVMTTPAEQEIETPTEERERNYMWIWQHLVTSERQMLEMNEALLARLSFIDQGLTVIGRRSMADNIKPHEAMRVIMEVFRDFDIRRNVNWPLRRIRNTALEYFRALSLRYQFMKDVEKSMLVKMIVFEACMRYVYSLQGEPANVQRYDAIILLCEAKETAEGSMCTDSKFFLKDHMRSDNVSRGYETVDGRNFASKIH